MSINRMCLSDEPERIYGGRKSIEAMLKQIYEFAMRVGFTNCVPPAVMVLENSEQISSICVPDSDGPVTRGGR